MFAKVRVIGEHVDKRERCWAAGWIPHLLAWTRLKQAGRPEV